LERRYASRFNSFYRKSVKFCILGQNEHLNGFLEEEKRLRKRSDSEKRGLVEGLPRATQPVERRILSLGEALMNGTLVVTIKKCARCLETHPDLTFSRLDNPMIVEFDIDGLEGKRVFHYWAMCPIKQEPVLLEVSDAA
jgi:hypothetical protein